MIDMKHIINGEENTVTAAFRAKRSFLSLMMEEPGQLQMSLINSAITEKADYNQKANPTPINFIIPLSGRSDSVRVFLDRLKVAALSHKIHINVKVVYFANDDHSTPEDERKLKEMLDEVKAQYPKYLFEIHNAEGAFSRGKGIYFQWWFAIVLGAGGEAKSTKRSFVSFNQNKVL